MLRPQAVADVPEETKRIAHAAFPKGNLYIQLREELGVLYEDEDFRPLFSPIGRPTLPPWRLALVTVFQFMENLTDRQAANAVRARIDWKYALGLELEDSGFDYSVLSDFRSRLIAGDKEHILLDKLLMHFKAKGLLKSGGKQRTDSTHVLAHIRLMNRTELVGESLRAALNELASVVPEWLRDLAPASWYERYGRRIENYRLPKAKAARESYLLEVGQDGFALLDAVDAKADPTLEQLPKLQVLRQVWERHYERKDRQVRWRDGEELSTAAHALESPYETEAKYSSKRGTIWTGYKVHLSESCDEDMPRLILHAHTTPATQQDVSCTAAIHESLAKGGLLPKEHLVDAGYVDAELLVQMRKEHGVQLIGPSRVNPNWQGKVEGGVSIYDFTINWQKQQARCPGGKTSIYWRPYRHKGKYAQDMIQVRFAASNCQACALKAKCTRSTKQGRILNVQPEERFKALRATRELMASAAGQQQYALRAGIEGTLSQGVRAFGMRVSRYRGQAKTHLQQLGSAAAINLLRYHDWQQEKPRGRTRVSRFMRLMPSSLPIPSAALSS